MQKLSLPAVLLAMALTGCGNGQHAAAFTPTATGADRDVHGCIASAGYRWCAKTGQCERPWELAKQQGFANNAQTFATWCRPAD